MRLPKSMSTFVYTKSKWSSRKDIFLGKIVEGARISVTGLFELPNSITTDITCDFDAHSSMALKSLKEDLFVLG